MASLAIVLRKDKLKKDGTCPLVIRIIKDRKPKYIFTGYSIFEKDWNSETKRVRKSHLNSKRLNNYLLIKLAEVNDTALEAETVDDNISSKEIGKKVTKKRSHLSFFKFGAGRVKTKYLAEVYSVAKAERSILYNIQEFVNAKAGESLDSAITSIKERRSARITAGKQSSYSFLEDVKTLGKNNSLYFEDINETFINRFQAFCVSHLGMSKRTITNQTLFIRTLFNEAIRDNEVDAKHYPFAGDKIKIRIQSGHKIGLTRDEIEAVMALELEEGSAIWHTRNVWLLSFFFAGVRISDVLKLRWSDFKGERLYYVMDKNDKPVSLKVPERAQMIIEAYASDKGHKDDFIFPDLKHANLNDPHDVFVKSRNATSRFNKYLKRIANMAGIDKNMSNHISRHSFGNIAGDKINPLMLQKLYRHSSLKTTIGYQANFIHKEADDALDQVIGF